MKVRHRDKTRTYRSGLVRSFLLGYGASYSRQGTKGVVMIGRSGATTVAECPRMWMPMVLWTTIILLVLGLAWFVGITVVTARQVTRATEEIRAHYPDGAFVYEAVRNLGGADRAAAKVGTYLRLPECIAPDKKEACGLLHYCGPSVAKALPALIAILDAYVDESVPRRQKERCELAFLAANAVGEAGPAGKPAVPVLIRIMRRDMQERLPVEPFPETALPGGATWTRHASRILGQIGVDASQAVPDLRRALSDDASRNAAVEALGLIGPAAQAVAPDLELLLKEQSSRVEVALALWRIRGDAELALGVLIPAAASGDVMERIRASCALGKMGPAAKPALPKLRETLTGKRESWVECLAAITAGEAIWLITGDVRETIPVLIDSLSHPDRDVRSRSLKVLAAMGPAAKEACPAVARMVNGEWDGEAARETLWRIQNSVSVR